jgi:hypothetical protein
VASCPGRDPNPLKVQRDEAPAILVLVAKRVEGTHLTLFHHFRYLPGFHYHPTWHENGVVNDRCSTWQLRYQESD